VRDEHDRGAVPRQLPDDAVQRVDVRPGQGGGRLVHHDELGVPAEGAEDLDLLLVGRPQRSGVAAAVELEADRRGQLAAALKARLARLDAEEDVLLDGERPHDRQLLRDQVDARVDRVPGRTEPDRLAREQHLAVVGGVRPGDDLAEGGLARPVLAHEGVDRASADGQADARQGARAAEGLSASRSSTCAPWRSWSLSGTISPATPG
jgi:hypothetical protein